MHIITGIFVIENMFSLTYASKWRARSEH